MAPPFFPMAWTLIGAVIGAVVTVAWQAKSSPKPQGLGDCNFLLPRFFLILALQENLGKLLAAVEPEDTEDFCKTLVETLTKVQQQLVTLTRNLQSHYGFKNVTNEIDAELVTCLQRVPGGPSILEGYLPKTGQTWDALFEEKVEDELKFLDAEINDKELQEDLTMSCLHAIDRILKMLRQQEDFLNARTLFVLKNSIKTLKGTAKKGRAAEAKEAKEARTGSTPTRRIRSLTKYRESSGPTETPKPKTLRSHAGRLSDSEVPYVDFADLEEAVIRRYTVIKVFYATDRQVTEDGDYIGEISRREIISGHEESNDDHSTSGAAQLKEASPLQFGVAEVGIPDTHEVGGMEAPHAHEESSPLKHLVILSVDTKMRGNRKEFLSSVNGDLQQGELLIFIHGYNVSHKGALKRAAQLKYDLRFQGAVIAYSWSSQGKLYGYSHDEATVKTTVRYLKSFLLSIMKEVKAPRVHILAHSMGNRALIRALDMLHEGESFPPPRCRLSQIIFAAADERHSIFEKLVEKMIKRSMISSPESDAPDSDGHTTTNSNGMSYPREDLSPHLTVYCSTDDWALTASRYVHNFRRRLGDTRSFLEASHANLDFHDVVDASGMDVSSLHHSYYGDVPEVIQDLRVLLTKKIPAASRPNLHKITHLRRPFYAFDKRRWATH